MKIIISFILGIIVAVAIMSIAKQGTFEITEVADEDGNTKISYLMHFDIPLDDIPKYKTLIVRVSCKDAK